MVMYFAEDAVTAATSNDITSVLNTLGSVVTYLFGQLSSLVNIIMQNPLLLIPIGITLTYVVIRVFRTIFRLA